MIAEKARLEDELQSLMYEEAVLIIRIGKQIDGMEKTEHSRLLHLRYEEFNSLSDVAEIMGYEYGYMRKMHGAALYAFEQKYLLK